MIGRGKIRTDLGLAVSTQLVQKLAGYVVLLILARYLAKDAMGVYFYAATVAGMAALVTELGTSKHLVREAAQSPGRSARALADVLALRLPAMGVAFLAINAVTVIVEPDLAPIMLLTTAYVFLLDLYYSYGAVFVGRRWMGTRLGTGMVGPLLLVVLVLVAARAGASLVAILICHIVAYAIMLAVAWVIAARRLGPMRIEWRLAEARRVARVSLPFFLLAVLDLIHFKIDSIMLYALRSPLEVAEYEVAYKLLEVSRAVVRPGGMIFFPVVAALASDGAWRRVRRLSTRLLAAGLLGGVMVAAIVVPLAGWIVPLVWGARYAGSAPILQVLYLSVPPVYVAFVASFLASALHLERQAVRVLAVAAVVNIVANLFAIPRWGAVGAAWTTLATEALAAGWLTWLVAREVRRHAPAPVEVAS